MGVIGPRESGRSRDEMSVDNSRLGEEIRLTLRQSTDERAVGLASADGGVAQQIGTISWPNTLRSVSDSMRGRSCEVVRIERGHRSPTWSTSLHIVVVPTHAGTSIYWLHESLHPQKFIAIRGGVS